MASRENDGMGSESEEVTAGPSRRMLGAPRVGLAVVVVALGAAIFAMAFRASLQLVYRWLFGAHDVLEAFMRLPSLVRIAVPTAGGFLAGLVARATARVPGQGVGDVMEAVTVGRVRLSLRATASKALGSWLAIASGNAIGREGPLIQFGGSFGDAVARVAGVPSRSARALIAAGTAAGFAAAYNTPFAAVLFVVEVFTGIVVIDALVMVMIATAISTALMRMSVGGGPIYGQRAFTSGAPQELLAHVALGVLAALTAHGFMRMLAVGEGLFERLRLRQPWRAALGGALVGVFAVWLPQVTGNGYEPLNALLDGRYAIRLVALLVLMKAVATTSSVSSGSPGGVFTPSLFIGGGLGALWGHGVALLTGATGAEGSYALVGMAAVTAATTHAPMMASVLVFELSGDYALVLPLVLATAVSTLLSRSISEDSIYTAELRRRGIVRELNLDGRELRGPKR